MTALTALATLCVSTLNSAPVYSRPLETWTAEQVERLHVKHLGAAPPVATGVQIMKVSYASPNSAVGGLRLSGAVFFPTDQPARGLVVFYHGTSAKADKVPSHLSEEAKVAGAAFIGRGFAVAMPDYIGMGDSPLRHPYPLQRRNAWSGLDIVPAFDQIARERKVRVEPHLFLTGYSEGGGVAMWAARHAQERKLYPGRFKASAPLSGPYDLSATTAQSMISDQANPFWRGARVYLAAYMAYSSETWIPGADLESMFVPSFASYVDTVFQTSNSEKELTLRLIEKATQIRPLLRSVKPIMQRSFVEAIAERDLRHPLMRELAANDCYDWAPQVRMRMFAIERDFLVSPENMLKTLRTMRARGVSDTLVDALLLPDALDHMSAFPRLVTEASGFFESILSDTTRAQSNRQTGSAMGLLSQSSNGLALP